MDNIKEIVKKYWPYIVGGIVGLYLLLRFSGGGSSSGGTDLNSLYAAQAQAAAQNAALGAQATAAANQNALDNRALDAQIAKDNATLEVQKSAIYTDAFNKFQDSQAAMAQSLGSSSAAVINALNAPVMTAMTASATENAAALNAAAAVAIAGYQAQSDIVGSTAQSAGAIAQNLGSNQTQSQPAQSQAGDILGSILGAIGSAYSGGFYGTGSSQFRAGQQASGGLGGSKYYGR